VLCGVFGKNDFHQSIAQADRGYRGSSIFFALQRLHTLITGVEKINNSLKNN
jgi:hypothetical protein